MFSGKAACTTVSSHKGRPELSSCLPDQMSEESVYCRSNEIALVKDHVENEGVAVVLITGGLGFGKTTVASMAAQKIKEDRQTVLQSARKENV